MDNRHRRFCTAGTDQHAVSTSAHRDETLRCVSRLLDRLPGDFRAVFTEDAAATGAETVRAGVAGGSGGGQRGVQADLVLADFAPLLRDRLAAWTLPARDCPCHVPGIASQAPGRCVNSARSPYDGPQPTVLHRRLAPMPLMIQLHGKLNGAVRWLHAVQHLIACSMHCADSLCGRQIQDGDVARDGGQRAMLPARLRFAAHLVLALRALREAPGASEELHALDDLQVR